MTRLTYKYLNELTLLLIRSSKLICVTAESHADSTQSTGICKKMSFKKQRMVKMKFRGSDLADLDFWSKSDPFLVLSRPRRDSYGLLQV